MDGILTIGELFLGKYRVERLVGMGGMGAVYAAVDTDLERWVAIKVLLPEIARSPAAAARFVREGRAAARVEGEHVARVFAAGRTPEGMPYMILELLEGRDLREELGQGVRMGIAEAVDILCQALEGVTEAHRHGIIHRDLKPANLYLHRRSNGKRVVKVLDFGISKAGGWESKGTDPATGELTMTRTMLGSPSYMSPEQLADSRKVDCRADIWSLGIILHEMLAGAHPFDCKSLAGVVHAIMHREIPPLGTIRPEVPDALQIIVMRCLARDLSKRIGDASELLRLLTPFAMGVDDTLEVTPAPRVSESLLENDRASMEIETRVWSPPTRGATPFTVVPPSTPPRTRAPAAAKKPFYERLPVIIAVPVMLVFLAMLVFLYAFRSTTAPITPKAASQLLDSGLRDAS
ncbi:serine/threonine protein kinase [Pendulispora rubella]|uniref:Serine/threonine protein kinase n=1 Tax=Pendulispora rubella TaxID=2741070 RepID=A0ABZ2L967_9BACT